jgi:cyclopropane fatty-acyl-phospholipid synthase-like methyltransferase
MKIAETGFWSGNTEAHHKFDVGLANALTELFAGHTVIDLGCGEGKYVEKFHRSGIKAIGFDGNPNTDKIPLCGVHDLTKPLNKSYFDYVLCLEVGEHIPKDKTQALIDNIKNHNFKGIVISWAIPGQGGDGHVNELSNEEVIKMFSEYEYDVETSQHLRNEATLWWFKNTIMVFKSNQQAHNKD